MDLLSKAVDCPNSFNGYKLFEYPVALETCIGTNAYSKNLEKKTLNPLHAQEKKP